MQKVGPGDGPLVMQDAGQRGGRPRTEIVLLPASQSWRRHVTFSQLIALINEAYERTERLMARVPADLTGLFRIWYHDVGGAVLSACALMQLAREGKEEIKRTSPPRISSLLTVYGRAVAAAVTKAPFLDRLRGWLIRHRLTFFARVIDFTLRRVRRLKNHLLPAPPPPVRPPRETGAVYVVIEDGGSRNFLNPGLAVLRSLRAAGLNVRVLTTCAPVKDAVSAEDIPVSVVHQEVPFGAGDLHRRMQRYLRLTRFAWSNDGSSPEGIAVQNLVPSLCVYWERALSLRTQVREQFGKVPPQAILAVGEGHPLSVIAGPLGRRYAAPWIGWNQMLIMDTKDYQFFPATHHLFYGDHAVDIFRRAGGDLSRVTCVGSPVFDPAVERKKHKDEDRRTIRKLVPRWTDQSLVIVGSENRHGQEAELVPALRLLAGMHGTHTVLKLHPDDPADLYADLLQTIDPDGSRITPIRSCDITVLLNAGDLLITQYSNIIITAATLETPVLVCDFKNSRPLDFVKEGIASGAFTENELRERIAGLLTDPRERSERLAASNRNVTRFIHKNDGQSVQRVVDYVRGHLAPAPVPAAHLENAVGCAKG